MASSYACGSKVIYDFCDRDGNFDFCSGGLGIFGAGPSRSEFMGNQDRASMIYMNCKNPHKEPAVVFDGYNCMGY